MNTPAPACFSADLILVGLRAASAEDAIRALSCRLEECGYVKPSYCQAVLEREKVFATGLPVDPMGVAIPHTDAEHVLRMGIAVGQLAAPVRFGLMGGAGELDVDLVFLMALDNCTSQVAMLQSLADFVQKDDAVAHLRAAHDPQTILSILQTEISLAPQSGCDGESLN